MEDILASIRRIIADDQLQGGKTASTAGRRPDSPQGAVPDIAERNVVRTRTPYDDVLDLARMGSDAPQVQATQDAPRNGAAPVSAEAGGVSGYHEPDPDGEDLQEHSPVSSLRARLPEPVHNRPADYESTEEEAYEDEEGLLAAPLGASVLSAFETLAATVVLQNTPMLERVMRDLLRPMLKTWLDDNLPALVERLVRGEIERVARGGRG